MIETLYEILEKAGYTHPIHPPLTHMPTGLIVGALIFGFAAILFRRPVFAVSARHCFALALVFAFPTVFFGYADWVHHYAGIWTVPIKVKFGLTGALILLLITGVYLHDRGGLIHEIHSHSLFPRRFNGGRTRLLRRQPGFRK